jgi:carbon storage regulator
MLVVTCKVGESVTIGGDIVVKVLQQQGNKVQLGIEAPKSIAIERNAGAAPEKK